MREDLMILNKDGEYLYTERQIEEYFYNIGEYEIAKYYQEQGNE